MRRVLILGMLLLSTQALARDPGGKFAQQDPKRHEWFESLHSGKGPCCSDADGTAVSDADWESVNDPKKPNVHYRVRLDVSSAAPAVDMQWIDVPDDAVLTQPNLYGKTVVWPIRYSPMGGPVRIEIRCFIPGAQI